MATAIVSDGVDEAGRQRADAYIRGADDPLVRLTELRESFGTSEWLVNLTNEGLREVVASRYA